MEDRYKDSPYRPHLLRDGSALASVRTFEVLKSERIDGGSPLFTIRISTQDVDRGNDVMHAQGVKLANYLNNPVVLWSHEHWTPAIGIAHNIVVGDTYIDAVTEFHERTQLSWEVAALVAGGYLRTASIGAIPLRYGQESPVTQEMIDAGRAYPGIGSIRHIEEWELIEYSIVNVPMNQNALIQNSFDAILRRAINDGAIAADAEILRRHERLIGAKSAILRPYGKDAITASELDATTTEKKQHTPHTSNKDIAKMSTEEILTAIEDLGKQLQVDLMNVDGEHDQRSTDAIEAIAITMKGVAEVVGLKTQNADIKKIAQAIIKSSAAHIDAVTALGVEPASRPEDEPDPQAEDPATDAATPADPAMQASKWLGDIVEAELINAKALTATQIKTLTHIIATKAGARFSKETLAAIDEIRSSLKQASKGLDRLVASGGQAADEGKSAAEAVKKIPLSAVQDDILKRYQN